jgi:PREDICTED: similar to CG16953-PA isoform 1
VPVASCILAVLIIIGGIALHMKHRRNLTIEVADFDFQSVEELSEKTFFERLKESLGGSLKSSILHPCSQRSNYEDLIDDSFTNDCDFAPPELDIGECNLRFNETNDETGNQSTRT